MPDGVEQDLQALRAEGSDPEVPSAPEPRGEAGDSVDTLVGRVISDRYRVVRRIATGGMSSVYQAEHIHMLKQVAVKVLDPKAERLPELVQRFQREAIAGAHVRHPNLAAATDFGQLEDGSYFLVLEYVNGTTLDETIAKGPIPFSRAVHIVRQIAAALAAAHEKGVVHRDLKPKNVMLVGGGEDAVKLIDFGLAQVKLSQLTSVPPPSGRGAQPDQPLTGVGVVFGTVAYMAPEASLGMASVDTRSDLYALGLIFYELLTGRHPFDAAEPVQLFLQQRTQPPPPLSVRVPGVVVPAPIEAVVMRLLEKNPEARYQTALEVIGAVDSAVLEAALSAVTLDEGLSELEERARAAPEDEVRLAPPAIDRFAGLTPPPFDAAEGGPTLGMPSASRVPAEAPVVKAALESRLDTDDLATIAARPAPQVEASSLGSVEPPAVKVLEGAPVGGGIAQVLAAAATFFERLTRGSHELFGDKRRRKVLVMTGLGVALLGTVLVFVAVRRHARSTTIPAALPAPVASASSVAANGAPSSVPADPSAEPSKPIALDSAGYKSALRNAVRAKDFAGGVDATLALLRTDPGALRERDPQSLALASVIGLAQQGGEPADKTFGLLTDDLGPPGLDLLYELARWRQGTKASKRAREILRRPEIVTRAQPELQILLELLEASCPAKRSLFGRVAELGDGRALFELIALRETQCNKWRDPCCFKESRELSRAINALRSRLSPSSGSSPN